MMFYGGYFTVRALLQAPDVYHVGVAVAGSCVGWFRPSPYLGPIDQNKKAYEYRDNCRLAGNLKGKLLLISGTSDPSAFSGTMKMVEALIRAGKPYDLIVLPEQGHSFSGKGRTYVFDGIRRYFQEHLKP